MVAGLQAVSRRKLGRPARRWQPISALPFSISIAFSRGATYRVNHKLTTVYCKNKVKWVRYRYSCLLLISPLRELTCTMGSDHTVLPATRQKWRSRKGRMAAVPSRISLRVSAAGNSRHTQVLTAEPPKSAPTGEGNHPTPFNTRFLGRHECTAQTASRSVQPFTQGSRAVLTNGHTGHVPTAPGFFFFLRGPQLAVVK